MKNITHSKKGQALITLLIFMVIGLTVSSAATILIVSTGRNTTRVEMGLTALHIAESGAENAILRLLRDPNYTGTGYNGESALAVGNGTAVVSITGTNPKTITSEGRIGNFVRRVVVVVSYSSILNVTSWTETY